VLKTIHRRICTGTAVVWTLRQIRTQVSKAAPTLRPAAVSYNTDAMRC
jgi:hypothetical protein